MQRSCNATSIFIVLFFTYSPGLAQSPNLVPNPGFEVYEKCPDNYTVSYKKELVPGWFLPTGGTSDYFNSCTRIQVGVPQNFMGYCLPKDGQAYAGLILLLEPPADSTKGGKVNYREYLQSRLTGPLKKDQWYGVTFYFSVAPYSTFAINRLGAYLSEKKISKGRSTKVLAYKPQITMDTTVILTELHHWFAVTGTYKARGGEQYITIGNFYNDNETRYKPLDLTGIGSILQSKIIQNQVAYYYIDMVSIYQLTMHN
jgi:OmpA-OmpF porin, OOP family